MIPGKLKVLCLFRDQFAHIKPVEAFLSEKAEFIYDDSWNTEVINSVAPDIVIGINEFHLDIARCYAQVRKLDGGS